MTEWMTKLSLGDKDSAKHSLQGIGVDAEQVARFEKIAAAASSWRHVYSAREVAHLTAQPHAAQAFCIAFCCKEAFCKALGSTYSFPEFECLYLPGASEQTYGLAPHFKERYGLHEARVRIHEHYLGERGEFVVEVHLIRSAVSHLETLQVATVEAERRRIEGEHFSAREIADLGGRRVQSVAGFLALKRALARLWAAEGGVASVEPRDFELGHHASGAPRIVAAPEGVALSDAFVSITHTRQWAYALAAVGR